MYLRPKQKVSKAQKTPEWYKDNAKFIVNQCDVSSNDRIEMVRLYEAAMGIITASSYKYVLNPYNTPEENLSKRQYPAQIRNYDIITPIIGSFVGDKGERPFNHQVITTNADSPNQFSAELAKKVEAASAQHIVNELNTQGFPTGVPSKQVPPIEQVIADHKEGFNDKRALFGQEALDYLKYNLDLKDKFQEAIYDWLVVGRAYTYKDVYKDDVIHQIVPPLELNHGTSETGFTEDADWARRRSRYNLSMCIDRFHEVLAKEEIDWLEDKFRVSPGSISTTFLQTANLDRVRNSSSTFNHHNIDDLIDVHHCVWKSFTKYGVLTYINELGQEAEMEVSEDYVVDKTQGDIDIEWLWNGQTEEVYIIGDPMGDCLLKYMRPTLVQRNELSNTSKTKLPYNGRCGYSERNKITSIVKQLLPYQVLFNIYHFRGELTLARNKDKIMLMPKGLMPAGWTEDKFLYFAESTGIAFFDEAKPNAASVLNAIRGIDMGLGTYISQMRELLAGIKMEAWDSIGMNRQRQGEIKASDGKGNTDAALSRSAIITAEMFRRFEKWEETEMQGLLDNSKLAWVNGKKGQYVASDGRRAWLNLENPSDHLESDYAVFAVNGREEQAKLDMAKQYAFGWAQKGTSPASDVLSVIDANNMSKLKDLIKKAESINRQYEWEQQQSEQQHQQDIEAKKTERDHEANQTKIEVAKITANASIHNTGLKAQNELDKIEAQPQEENGTGDPIVDQAYNNYLEAVREHDARKQEQGMKAAADFGKQRLAENKMTLDRDKMESAEKIAKQNRNRYDS